MSDQSTLWKESFSASYTERLCDDPIIMRALRSFDVWVRTGLFQPKAYARYLCIELEGWQNMARGKSGQSRSDAWAGAPKFVDVPLNAAAKAEFTALSYAAQDVLDGIERIVNDGHRVGLAYSVERSSYTVSLTGRDDGCANKGLCMTSFASTPLRALALAVYKHQTLCDGVWTLAGVSEDEDFG